MLAVAKKYQQRRRQRKASITHITFVLVTKNNGNTDAKYVMPHQYSTVLIYKMCNMYSVSA